MLLFSNLEIVNEEKKEGDCIIDPKDPRVEFCRLGENKA